MKDFFFAKPTLLGWDKTSFCHSIYIALLSTTTKDGLFWFLAEILFWKHYSAEQLNLSFLRTSNQKNCFIRIFTFLCKLFFFFFLRFLKSYQFFEVTEFIGANYNLFFFEEFWLQWLLTVSFFFFATFY